MHTGPKPGSGHRREPKVARWLAPIAVVAATTVAVVSPASTVGAQAAPADLFFSEYIEGTSNNKALEIYNGTGAAIDVGAAAYNVQMHFNGGSTAGLTINLNGTVASGDVFVLAQASAGPAILTQADQTNAAGWFNGDDAVVLRKGATVIDVIGQVGFDPGTEWGAGLTSTADNTLRRLSSVCQGDANGSDAFDPTTEWEGLATDTFDGLGAHAADCADVAPRVASTSPADGASDVARNADVVVNFSEPVDVTGSWFTIVCAASGAHTAVVSGGPSTFTLNPAGDFAANETCTVTVAAANVTDQDTDDPPDAMAADASFDFTTIDAAVCGDPATAIHEIQGTGASSSHVGSTRSIEGVVVGDYQGPGQFSGYYVQEEDDEVDTDPTTSEGIFVFNTAIPVNAGDVVRVRGTVGEFPAGSMTSLTQLGNVTSVLPCGSGAVTPTAVQLPVASVSDWERYEGMSIVLPQTMAVTDTFTLGRFGEVGLSVGSRLPSPTAVAEPGAPAIAVKNMNDRSRIVLDDANNQQNIDPTRYPDGGLSASNTLRGGDTVTGLTGVLDQRFNLYRIEPVGPVDFVTANPRPTQAPEVGGLRVASFNVLNYFLTLDTGGNQCGPVGNQQDCRGAESQVELDRQQGKLVPALAKLDADVIGLVELENTTGVEPLADLVTRLNDLPGGDDYAYIDTGTIGTDAIKVGLIYRVGAVSPVGDHAILTSRNDPRFVDTLNRPTLAQSFSSDKSGEVFTVVVNHLKSKNCGGETGGDVDDGDGHGCFNATRTAAAEALVDWIASDPTGVGDDDALVVGDLNSYAKEDPIDVFVREGYVDLVGESSYSFSFNGEWGSLDYALASPSLAEQKSAPAEDYHINADEPTVLDYNINFKSANHVQTLYAPDEFRTSDHDPVISGYKLQGLRHPFAIPWPFLLWPANGRLVNVDVYGFDGLRRRGVTIQSVTSSEADSGLGANDQPGDIVRVDDDTVRLRAERFHPDGRTYTIEALVTDGRQSSIVTTKVFVPRRLGF